jgi:hypothetical protein
MRSLAVTLVALVLTTGCAPRTLYRYSALTPAAKPIAWDGRTPRAGLFAEGTYATSTVHPNLAPRLHDTAMWVAEHSLDGTVGVVPMEGVQLGLRGSYADYRWAVPSAAGTMPLPSRPTLLGLGPDLRASLRIGRQGFAVGVAMQMTVYSVPYARWRLDGPQSAPAAPRFDGYVLEDFGSELHFVFSGGLYPSWAFGPGGRYGRAFGMLGLTTGFSNDGFTNELREGSTIASHVVPLVGSGYGYDAGPVHASVMLYAPLVNKETTVAYGPGVLVTVGVRLGLWSERRPLGVAQ